MRPEDVPAGPVLVDTDVATWLLGDRPEAEPWLPLLRGHLLTLSFVNVGELLAYPISRSWGSVKTTKWSEGIRNRFVVLPFNVAVTEQWAPMHLKYSGHLQRGGANDLWIAASALAANPMLPLATNNLSDFQKVADEYPLTIVHPSLSSQRRQLSMAP